MAVRKIRNRYFETDNSGNSDTVKKWAMDKKVADNDEKKWAMDKKLLMLIKNVSK